MDQLPDTLLEVLLAVAGGSTLVMFGVGLQNFFIRPATSTRPQQFFQHFSVVVSLIHGSALLVLDAAGSVWAGIGITMYAGALTLFLSAIEAVKRAPITPAFVYEPRCDRILTTGPYRVIRHPIYLSYSLAWLAAPVALHSVLLLITAVFLIACYVVSAAEEERRLGAGPLADKFNEHCAATWRLIPFVY